jgi:ABC-type multidrug transport system fused ATPase/permease subunit
MSELLPIASRRDTTHLMTSLLARHRGRLAAAVAAFAGAGVAGLVPPWMFGVIVDDVRAGRDRVWESALVIIVASVVSALLSGLSIALLAKAGEPALASLREEVLDAALHLDSDHLEKSGTGDLLSRVGDDVQNLAQSLNNVVPTLAGSVVTVTFTVLGLFVLDWPLALAVTATLPLYVLGLRWYLPLSGPYYAEERVAQGERAEALVTAIQAAPSVRAFGIADAQLSRIETTSRSAMRLSITVYNLLMRFLGRNNRAEFLGLTFVLGLGFFLVRGGHTTVGAVTAAALYFQRLFNPIGGILFVFDEVQSAGASLARLAGVAALRPRHQDAPDVPADGTLELRDVYHEYEPGIPILHHTTLRLRQGERVALVGETGAGKTTIAEIAAGVLRPTGGSVSFAGKHYSDLGPRGVRSRVTLVSQEGHVFAGTVRDALTLARPDVTHEEMREALDLALCGGWVDVLPDGIDTVVGEQAHQLDPGQAQQLALARVALLDPRVIVLDEATAEAGSAGAHDLERAANRVLIGRTSLVVAHRLTQSRAADRVLVLHNGVIVEDGSHDDLVAAGGRYAQLWQAWSTP